MAAYFSGPTNAQVAAAMRFPVSAIAAVHTVDATGPEPTALVERVGDYVHRSAEAVCCLEVVYAS